VTTLTTDDTGAWMVRQGWYRGGADARRGNLLVIVAEDKSGAPVTVSCGRQTMGAR
jgi:hypothetical protein